MSSICLNNDQITRLFHDHREAIIIFLTQKVHCPTTAQDLSQETYLRLLRQESVPHTDNLAGYLYRTAERLAIDFLRYDQRIGKHSIKLDENLECPQIQPEAGAILRQQCELLIDAIAALPCQCRHVLLLRKIDELSYAEIATQLNISEKTVQRHLVKAMMHCHRRLGHNAY
ncbi:MAG: sigma-70 family RNA polymerase sigma factor [Methylobacter sp.]|nr:sigma-70 family RNA polymerase sigma factor [Methylobacter sp.]